MKKQNKKAGKASKARDMKPKKDVKGGWGVHHLGAQRPQHLGSEQRPQHLGSH